MKRIMVALIAVLLFVTPALAETKIGYVDLQKALNLSKAGAQAKSDISNLVKNMKESSRASRKHCRPKEVNCRSRVFFCPILRRLKKSVIIRKK